MLGICLLRSICAGLLVHLAAGGALAGTETKRSLCPNLIASLMTIPGNLDALTAAQRLEIRQCPVDIKRLTGWFQLVAWEQGATEPALVFQTEDSGFYQLAMIEGVYVFELIGGRATRTVAIVFDDQGKPGLAMNEPSRHKPRIQSDSSGVVVELVDLQEKPRRYVFKASGVSHRR